MSSALEPLAAKRAAPRTRLLLGVDTGGTFTDFVLFDGHHVRIHKVLSTPDAPERAIVQGLAELGLDVGDDELSLIHGSTVATNAVLEGKGVPTVYITNRGLADVLAIGRQARAALYDLQPEPAVPPVPKARCLETGGRLGADGRVVEPLTDADLDALARAVVALSPRAVAINLLFSFLDDRFERAIESVMPPGVFVSRSSDVLPEYKEYERGIATWLNAWVGPLVEGYLRRLREGVPRAAVAIMQSSGETIDAAQAGRQAVRMLLSGPAGGLAGARFVAARAGHARLLTFDMGGTSTDIALVEGDVRLTSEGCVGPYPVAVPMVDMHTIGAGGGSVAVVDAGGLLRVGPQSAGATPGPACYARGGQQATVTDANVVLGRIPPEHFLGGTMPLDVGAARQVVGRIATDLGMTVEEAALGIVRVANEHMARALRVMSVQRGVDPRELTLVSFGGAGGLHVCALAEALGMRTAIVPSYAGVLSALGMLAAPRGRQLSRTVEGVLEEMAQERLEAAFEALIGQGRAALAQEGVAPEGVSVERSVDLRYRGQSYALNIPWSGPRDTEQRFHEAHRVRYGHRLDHPVQLVNVRVGLKAPAEELRLSGWNRGSAHHAPIGHAALHGFEQNVAVWDAERLAPGRSIAGPALVTARVSTTYVAPHWRCSADPSGTLLLDFRG